jgi:hypothetical protein
MVKTKRGQSDVTRVSGSGNEDFAVTNTITSKDASKTSFDQTSPSFNEVKPTKPISKKSIKSKKSGKFHKSQNDQIEASENTLQEKFTTTPMSAVLETTYDPFSDGMNFFTTTPSIVTKQSFFSTPPVPTAEGTGPSTTTFTRQFYFSRFTLMWSSFCHCRLQIMSPFLS